MKKTDIAMIILIATSSILIAFFVTRAILGDSGAQEVKVNTIDEISASIDEPDPTIFNSSAINPAVGVKITSSNP